MRAGRRFAWPAIGLVAAALACPAAAWAAESAYTNLKLDSEGGQCRTVKTTDDPYSGEFECPGFAGWRVRFLEDADARSWLVLAHGGRSFDLYQGIAERTPGFFPALAGTPLEWRHDPRTKRVEALIFRVKYALEDGTERTILLVARVTDGAVCLIGGASTNEGARAIADRGGGCP